MLLPLEGRRLYYDLTGPEDGPVVCMTHSLMSDSGMWSEQMPTLLQAGFRVLRLDMRGHGGSDPGAGGDYTMRGIADDWPPRSKHSTCRACITSVCLSAGSPVSPLRST